ncbi:MAG: hypothetical protein Q9178_004805 [Gyalolechia marmorata]
MPTDDTDPVTSTSGPLDEDHRDMVEENDAERDNCNEDGPVPAHRFQPDRATRSRPNHQQIEHPEAGEPRTWKLEEAYQQWHPSIEPAEFCVFHASERDETKRVLLAVNDGDRPSTASERQETSITKRLYNKRYVYWTLDKDGWRYIVSFDETYPGGPCWRRWSGVKERCDLDAIAFPVEVTI